MAGPPRVPGSKTPGVDPDSKSVYERTPGLALGLQPRTAAGSQTAQHSSGASPDGGQRLRATTGPRPRLWAQGPLPAGGTATQAGQLEKSRGVGLRTSRQGRQQPGPGVTPGYGVWSLPRQSPRTWGSTREWNLHRMVLSKQSNNPPGASPVEPGQGQPLGCSKQEDPWGAGALERERGRGWDTGLCRRLEWAGSDGLLVSLSTPARPAGVRLRAPPPGARRESQGPHGWAEVGAHAMTQKKPTLWASSRGPEWPGLPTPPPGVPRCVILARRPTPQLEPGLGD